MSPNQLPTQSTTSPPLTQDDKAPDSSPARPLIALVLGAGILAGLLSWLIGEAALGAFRPPLQRSEVMGRVLMKADYRDQAAADFKNAVLGFSILGAILGASLGAAGGLARGCRAAAIGAGLTALPIGTGLAAVASLALLPFYYGAEDLSKEELSRDLILPLFVHTGIWAAAGLGGGIGLGLGLGGGRNRLIKSAIGGLIGAAMGSALYEIIGAVAFPGGKTTPPLGTDWTHRIIARLLVTILASLVAALFVNMQSSRSEQASPAS